MKKENILNQDIVIFGIEMYWGCGSKQPEKGKKNSQNCGDELSTDHQKIWVRFHSICFRSSCLVMIVDNVQSYKGIPLSQNGITNRKHQIVLEIETLNFLMFLLVPAEPNHLGTGYEKHWSWCCKLGTNPQ